MSKILRTFQAIEENQACITGTKAELSTQQASSQHSKDPQLGSKAPIHNSLRQAIK